MKIVRIFFEPLIPLFVLAFCFACGWGFGELLTFAWQYLLKNI